MQTLWALQSYFAALSVCNLGGNWAGPPDGSGFQIKIVQAVGATNFTFFYSAKPNGAPGTIIGQNVTIPGFAGAVSTSTYPNFRTNATAPECTFLTFNGVDLWCKYPFCPHAMPPEPLPTIQIPLTLLPQEKNTDTFPANLDGSPYGYYFSPSQSGKSTKWTISIEGGGWCYNEAECYSRSKTALGTSTAWPKTLPFSLDPYGTHFKPWEMGCMNAEGGSLDMDCNSLYLPYGDGASFSGFRSKPWPVSANSSEMLWFRGIQNLEATIAWALSHGLANATELVVTGVSAGGLSSFLHMDLISAMVKRQNPLVQVRGAPVVGYFLDHPNFANDTATSYTTEMAYLFRMQNLTFGSGGGLTSECQAAYPEHPAYCVMSPHMLQFIKTPFFVFNSRFDAWQLSNILQISNWKTTAEQDAVVEYGASFLTQFAPVRAASKNGAFISTCICHACPFPTLVLDGKTSFQHYAAWYEGSTTGADSIHVDTRGPNGDGTLTDPLCLKFP
jgi:hypothetical protein